MWSGILDFIGAVCAKVIVSFLASAKAEADAQTAAVQAAAETTSQVVKDTADARATISDSTSIDALTQRLRDDASRS